MFSHYSELPTIEDGNCRENKNS